MSKEIVWMSKDKTRYTMKQIDDRYLLAILGFICKGGSYIAYTDDDNIVKLFGEATKRGLTHNFSINNAFRKQKRRREELEIIYENMGEFDSWMWK